MISTKKTVAVLNYSRSNSDNRIEADRNIIAMQNESVNKLFYVSSLKERIAQRIFEDQSWRSCGLQLSLAYGDGGNEQGLIEKIFELRTHLLLEYIYDLIVREKDDYRLVFLCLQELLYQHKLLYGFKQLMRDPLNMLKYCIKEHENQSGHETSIETLLQLF